MRTVFRVVTITLLAGAGARGAPADVGMDAERLARIDAAVARALADRRAPGAVVLVLRQGKVAFRKAYGDRQVEPAREPMTVDTVFDLASLTKPIATATAVMLLLEEGKLRLEDRVARHFPEFGKHGKDVITVEQLLLHTSGLIADNPVGDYLHGKKKAFENICDLKLQSKPGSRFTYSDVGFLVLGELVEKLSGQPLDVFCQRRVFGPLGMKDTTFRPGKELAARAAPTEREKGEWLRGVVHDPRSRAIGGVAGHAGLFGTADDLAVYAQMLLDGGRLLKAETVKLFTTPRDVPRGRRTPGWDARTSYSAPRGKYFGGFGHTGFTGTSIWVDPASQTAVLVLTNRVHPDGKGNVTALRAQVADIVAEAIVQPPFPPDRRLPVRAGLDVLRGEGFKRLGGKRVGLVTNHTGVSADGASAIDLLHDAPGVKLVALFSPEHGIRGLLDERVDDGKDEKTGLPIFSLYGKARRPTKEQLQGIDTLVYDIQDIGCRFYTYITTLGYLLEEAAKHGVEVVVLDRPNPIGGVTVEGPILDSKSESFVAYHPLPVRHGMTVGELALLFNTERKIGARLSVVKAENWRRGDLFDRTGLVWRNPSPNMRSLTAALLYPGVGLLETTNLSVGRGTDRPFELLGAPWMDGRKVAAALSAMELPGVRFVPTRFTPQGSVHAKRECGGVQIYISDWARFESLPVGFAVAQTLRQLYPGVWQTKSYNRLLGNAAIFDALNKGESAAALMRLAEPGRKAFLEVRKRYLLYGD